MRLETTVEKLKALLAYQHVDGNDEVIRDALRLHALVQAIAETRALPYISEATAAEIFQRLDTRADEILRNEMGMEL